jgi:hypothetical protein
VLVEVVAKMAADGSPRRTEPRRTDRAVPKAVSIWLRFAYRLYVAEQCAVAEGLTPEAGAQLLEKLLDLDTFRSQMAFADFLRTLMWTAWVTPTFDHPITERRARALVMRWLRRQGRHAYAAIVYERGPAGRRLHPHLLIGGCARPDALRFVASSWPHGRIDVKRYDPTLDYPGRHHGASWYLSKTGTDGVAIIGTPKVYRRRRSSTTE